MSPGLHLADLTGPDLDAGGPRLLLLPLGSCEQHGPHLPLDTDTRIAAAVAAALAAERGDLVVAPALQYGASGEHQGFAGTVSIGTAALEQVLVELARSLGPEFAGLVLLSWHGGNLDAVRRAIPLLRAEGRRVLGVFPGLPEGDAHAGRSETSLMLALDPAAVRLDRAAPGDPRPLAEVMPLLREGGMRAVTPSGVLGDPAGASAEEGRRLLATLVDTLREQIERWLEGGTGER